MRALLIQVVCELRRRLWVCVLVLVGGCAGLTWHVTSDVLLEPPVTVQAGAK